MCLEKTARWSRVEVRLKSLSTFAILKRNLHRLGNGLNSVYYILNLNVCVCVCVVRHAHAYGCQRMTLGVVPQASVTSFYLIRVCVTVLGFLTMSGWWPSKSQGFSCLYLASTR